MVSVTVSPAGKPISIARGIPSQFDIPGKQVQDATIGDVKVAIAKKFPKVSPSPVSALALQSVTLDAFQFYPARQKITLKDSKNTLNDETKLVDAGVVEGGELLVKDLGHQVSWKTVFLVEYVSRRVKVVDGTDATEKAGPLVIHPILFYFPEYIWGGPVYHSMLQRSCIPHFFYFPSTFMRPIGLYMHLS
jgi:very-long-chain enoyl-CoA reductase